MVLSIIALALSIVSLGLALIALIGVGKGAVEMRLGFGRVIMAMRRANGLPETPPDMRNPLADIVSTTTRGDAAGR